MHLSYASFPPVCPLFHQLNLTRFHCFFSTIEQCFRKAAQQSCGVISMRHKMIVLFVMVAPVTDQSTSYQVNSVWMSLCSLPQPRKVGGQPCAQWKTQKLWGPAFSVSETCTCAPLTVSGSAACNI